MIVGMMFVMVSVAMSSAVENKSLLLQWNDSEETKALPFSDFHAIVRSRQVVEQIDHGSTPVQLAHAAIMDSLQILSDPERLTSNEQITFEVHGENMPSENSTARTTRKTLIDIVVRRASLLNLRITFRVAPTMLFEATELLNELQSQNALRIDQFALSVDREVSPDSLFIDLIRYSETDASEDSCP
jgi:hypothetical protein